MKDVKLFKKWWFWVIIVAIGLGLIGSLFPSDTETSSDKKTTTQQQAAGNTTPTPTLPKLNTDEYKGQEGLVIYKDLKAKGYTVEATFEKQALTDINGKATDVFEPLDPSKPDDRTSVDSFVVSNLTQAGDSVELLIAHSVN